MIPVPKGYLFAAAKAGFKKPDRLDAALIVSDRPAAVAGAFTSNRFKAAPVLHCLERLKESSLARGILANSGQANACTGEDGREDCRRSLELAARSAGVEPRELLPASTGVIGRRFDLGKWRIAAEGFVESLGHAGPMDCAKAIMTTDSFPKVAWARVEHKGKEATVLGLAKGAGMICPDMATMLSFVVTDAAVDPEWWKGTVPMLAENSFNRITVDGDTSTNDCLIGLANGAGGLDAGGEEVRVLLAEACLDVCRRLALYIVQDAEGGTKTARINVTGALDDGEAELAARAVGNSPLVKTALFGMDANWGRVVAALGRSGARFQPEEVTLAFGPVTVFEEGRPVEGDMDSLLAPLMKRNEIAINVSLGKGPGCYELLASDLTYDYVRINADYRT